MRGMFYILKKQGVLNVRLSGGHSSGTVPEVKTMTRYSRWSFPKSALVACLMVGLLGCVGPLKRSLSDRDRVAQVMQRWAEGWAELDADLLEPLLSETYYGANGENKNDLLSYVRQWGKNPENRAAFVLDQMTVEVQGDQATARGVWARIEAEESDIVGQFKLDYSLQKEEGIWRITAAALVS
jgi:hypothetical protein